MKKTTFKFKVGDVIEHKASGEKVVVVKCMEEEEKLSGGSFPSLYTQSAQYSCDMRIKRDRVYINKESCEIIFKKI